jgi:ABC-type multidrug transport system ATPase subunit
VGYCPQEDPLLELLTGEETLLYFGRLKGLGAPFLGLALTGRCTGPARAPPVTPPSAAARDRGDPREAALRREVSGLLQSLGLGPFKDEPCGGYSGGMKRKLSFALALVGGPAVLLLDEPSTGTSESERDETGAAARACVRV